ncbi:MAG: DNA-binding domain-containing protein [Planctomycetales bacterium]
MTGDPRELRTIQEWMQAVITHPEGVAAGIDSAAARAKIDVAPAEAERVVPRSKSLDAIGRLEIYANAYYARLLECLREEFPAFVHAVGQEVFDGFAFGYLQSYPSRSYTLAELGAHFPQYLRETRPEGRSDELRVTSDGNTGDAPDSSLVTRHSSLELSPAAGVQASACPVQPEGCTPADWTDFLIDLATLERTYSEVFDGPGIERERLLQPADLQAVSPEAWPRCRLVLVECLRLAAFRYPVHEYATAVRKQSNAEIPAPSPTWLVITRRDYVVRRAPLSFPQFALLEALSEGASVGDALERTAAAWEGDFDELASHVGAWFREWAQAGHFRRLEVD